MTPDQVVAALQQGSFDAIADAASPDFAPELREQLPAVWRQVVDACGVPNPGQMIEMHDVALVGATDQAHLQVTYEDGLITGLVLRPGAPTGVFGH